MNKITLHAQRLVSLTCVALLAAPALTLVADAQTAPPSGTPAPPAPATNPAAPAAGARGARGGGGGPRGAPATDAEKAEMAKLMDLPAYAIGLPDGDYSTGPNYTPSPERNAREGVPKGKVIELTMNSADSKFFPGRNGAAFQRKVTVYVPSQYKAGTPAPFILSCDEYGASRNQLPNILDNEIADHRLPVMCAIMIANGGTAGGERSLEYDTLSPKYADFIESEVLPLVEKAAGVTLTKDPNARMTYGGSSGGICAFTMAWFHPELYHLVLSYSGSFTNLQRSPEYPHGGWEYPDNLIAKTPAKPLRIWLQVGQNDLNSTTAAAGYQNWVLANQRMAAALKAKRYHYQFVYSKNAAHVDGPARNQTDTLALEYLWRGYPIAGATRSRKP